MALLQEQCTVKLQADITMPGDLPDNFRCFEARFWPTGDDKESYPIRPVEGKDQGGDVYRIMAFETQSTEKATWNVEVRIRSSAGGISTWVSDSDVATPGQLSVNKVGADRGFTGLDDSGYATVGFIGGQFDPGADDTSSIGQRTRRIRGVYLMPGTSRGIYFMETDPGGGSLRLCTATDLGGAGSLVVEIPEASGTIPTATNAGSSGKFLRWGTAGTGTWSAISASELPSHILATTSGLTGTKHTVSGLTAGQVLRASTTTDAAFAQLAHADLSGVTANLHHNQSHVLATTSGLGADHSVSSLTAGMYIRAISATQAKFQTIPSGDLPSHTHDAGTDITSGLLPVARGGTAYASYTDDEFLLWTSDPSSRIASSGYSASDFAEDVHTHVKADITDTPWAWTDVSKTGSNLTDLATRQHAGLTGVSSDQHHAQSHVLATSAGLGADHTTSGLTAGWVLRASGATTAQFSAIQAADIPNLNASKITAGVFATGRIGESSVTQHQAALAIAPSQLSDTVPVSKGGTGYAGWGAGSDDKFVYYDHDTTSLRPSAYTWGDFATDDHGHPNLTFTSDPSVPGAAEVAIGYNTGNLIVRTDDGYVRIGPVNSSWCHFFTDRARFYFDKTVAAQRTASYKHFQLYNAGGGTKQGYIDSTALNTADRIWTFPDATGTVITTGNLSGITAVGTIASGVWQGTAINAAYVGNLPASQTTTGTFDAARIPNLAASKITSGTFPIVRGGTNASSMATGQFLEYDGSSITGSGYSETSFATASHNHDSWYPRYGTTETITAQWSFSGATVTNRVVLTGGFLGHHAGDADTDIWGISEDYYPSHGTPANQWGLKWASTPNQIVWVGNGADRMALDLDSGIITVATWQGTTVAVGYGGTGATSLDDILTGTGLGVAGGANTIIGGNCTISFTPIGLTGVTPVTDDYVVITDTSDDGNPKKALVSGLPFADSSHAHATSDITSGAFVSARLSGSYSGITAVGTIASGVWQGTAVASAYVGNLPASKITSGEFDVARIPALPASKITSGTFADARIPDLNASKITAGTFADARIPSLNASKITAGVFPIVRGGTNASSMATGQFLEYDGSSITGSGYSESSFATAGHNHDGTYLKLIGGTLTGHLNISSFDDDGTNIGKTGSTGLNSTTDTPAEWSSLRIAYRCMFANTVGTAGGAPVDNYGYFLKVANRDTAGGWGGLWVGYLAGENYMGRTSTSGSFASWDKLWSDANDGPGSGLNADLLDGSHAAAFATVSHEHATGDITSGSFVSARLSGSYTGITGVGTLAAGVWQGTAINAAYIGNLPASKTTTGTFDAARIPGLAASKITSGTLPIVRGGTNASSIASNQFLEFNGTSIVGSGYSESSFATSGHNHDATYLKLVGGTLTGALITRDITIQQGYKLKVKFSTFTKNALWCGGGDTNGLSVFVGGGALTAIGGGESAAAVDANVSDTSESLYLTSDAQGAGAIYLLTNIQAGWANRKIIEIEGADATLDLVHGGLKTNNVTRLSNAGVLSNVTANASIITAGTFPSGRLSGSYTGITGVGTLTAGTWNATTIAVAKGGTGTTSLDDILVGTGLGVSAGANTIIGGDCTISFTPIGLTGVTPVTDDYVVITDTSDDGNPKKALVSGLPFAGSSHTHATSDITSGTFVSARLSGSYSGITAVGTIAAGVWQGTAINATYVGSLPTSKITSGTFVSARLSGSYTGITGVGTIAAGIWQGSAIAAAYIGNLPTSKITSGTFADARISQGSVTQHEAALSIAPSQLSSAVPVSKGGTAYTSFTEGEFLKWTNTPSSRICSSGYDASDFAATSHAHSGADITSGTLPTGRLSGSYTGITAVGTIAAGVWQGTAIAAAYIGNLPASKITSGAFGVDRIPALPASKITSGTFPVNRGGTNNTVYTSLQLLRYNATGTKIESSGYLPSAFEPAITTLSIAKGGTNASSMATGQFLEYDGEAISGSGYNESSFATAGHTHSTYLLRDIPHSSDHVYHDLTWYSSGAADQVGTMKITLPVSWTNTMMHIVIKGFEYDTTAAGGSAWTLTIGGYNYSGGPYWTREGAMFLGSSKGGADQVRLAHDGTKCCILLGNLTSDWDYLKLHVSYMFAGHSGQSGWGTGWSISKITSEAGITNIVTPTTNTGMIADMDMAIGTLPDHRGGTGFTTYAKGDLLYASASNTLAKLAVGDEDEFLGTHTGSPNWQTVPIPDEWDDPEVLREYTQNKYNPDWVPSETMISAGIFQKEDGTWAMPFGRLVGFAVGSTYQNRDRINENRDEVEDLKTRATRAENRVIELVGQLAGIESRLAEVERKVA